MKQAGKIPLTASPATPVAKPNAAAGTKEKKAAPKKEKSQAALTDVPPEDSNTDAEAREPEAADEAGPSIVNDDTTAFPSPAEGPVKDTVSEEEHTKPTVSKSVPASPTKPTKPTGKPSHPELLRNEDRDEPASPERPHKDSSTKHKSPKSSPRAGQRCTHCNTTTTPTWRRQANGDLLCEFRWK
jgi:hypothetical protein